MKATFHLFKIQASYNDAGYRRNVTHNVVAIDIVRALNAATAKFGGLQELKVWNITHVGQVDEVAVP